MKPVALSIRRWEVAALLGILCLAGVLRLGAPGISEFKRDEGNMTLRALDLVNGRDFPLLGLSSSVSIPNPPISVYLFAIPYALDHDPRAATLFVGALNGIAVGLAWGFARRYYGPSAAVVAGLLYAAGPWAVIYSRKIWAQDLLPPFMIAVIWTGVLGFGERKRWAQWLHWPLLAITLQIHYAAFVLVPLTLIMMLIWRESVRWRQIVIVVGLAALTGLPAIIGAYQDHWLSLDRLREGMEEHTSDSDHQRVISTTALDYAWFTVAGTDIHSLAGPDQFQAYLDSMPNVYALFKLVPLAAILSAAVLGVRCWRKRTVRESVDLVLLLWLALPVLAFTWEWTEVAPHYMIPLMPASYILCGAGLAATFDRLKTPRARRVVAIFAGTTLVSVAALQVVMTVGLLRFLDRHATPGGFGTPLHYLLGVRDAILDQQPSDIIVISQDEVAPYDEVPAVWGALLDSVMQVRFVNGTHTAVIPAAPALELIAWSPGLRICADLTCQDQPGVQVFDRRPGEPPYLLRLIQPDLPVGNITPLAPIRFANGAYLIGYALEANSVVMIWQLGGPVQANYQAFVHALNASGIRLDQADRPAWPGRYWRQDDRLILWFDLTLPAETAALYVGMYTLEGENYRMAEVLDNNGAYMDQAATIPLTLPD
jgi:4-amino-4-deoxy-L-arabinose transferase-like glycosyltransferase